LLNYSQAAAWYTDGKDLEGGHPGLSEGTVSAYVKKGNKQPGWDPNWVQILYVTVATCLVIGNGRSVLLVNLFSRLIIKGMAKGKCRIAANPITITDTQTTQSAHRTQTEILVLVFTVI